MPTQARVIWDQSFTGYNFGADHPMDPLRLDLTARLCEELGLFGDDGVEVVSPAVPGDDVLLTVHDADYVAAVRAALGRPGGRRPQPGPGHRGRPGLRRDARGQRADRRGHRVDVAAAVWAGPRPRTA